MQAKADLNFRPTGIFSSLKYAFLICILKSLSPIIQSPKSQATEISSREAMWAH